jgi:hypothetical protein
VLENSGVYLVAAFVATALILAGYLVSLATRTGDAERDLHESTHEAGRQ